MGKGISPKDPSRADHRFIRYQLKEFLSKKPVHHNPSEYDHVSRVFARAGGSWERLFKGSVRDIVLLRRILKIAVKQGFISKREPFR